MSTVIGIDQSVRHTGVCVLSETGALEALALIEPPMQEPGARLAYIRDELKSYFTPQVRAAVMEGYSYNSVNKKFLLGEVGAIVKLTVFEANVTLYEAAPKQLKKFVTGKGGASKEDVMRAIEDRWKTRITNDNLADAYGLACLARELVWPSSSTRSQLEVTRAILRKGLLKRIPTPKVKGLQGAL